MRKMLFGVMTAAAAMTVLLPSSANASADVPGVTSAEMAAGISASAMQPTQTVTRTTDSLCQQARAIAQQPGVCQAEVTTSTGQAHRITPAELATYGGLKAANGLTVTQAAASSTVMINTWWQEQHGLYYINWKERHEGAWLYNGSIAWVSDAHGYTGGYHYCNRGYGIGYSIDVQYCDSRNQNTSRVDNVDAYQVHVIAKGIPLYASHSMTYHTYGSGASSA